MNGMSNQDLISLYYVSTNMIFINEILANTIQPMTYTSATPAVEHNIFIELSGIDESSLNLISVQLSVESVNQFNVGFMPSGLGDEIVVRPDHEYCRIPYCRFVDLKFCIYIK